MRSATPAVLGLAAALCLWSSPATAQDSPQGSWVTMQKLSVPFGAEGQRVMQWVDSVIVPQAKLNPNIQHMYVARHRYGADAGEMVIVRVYATWEDINAPCGDPCTEYNAANQVEEGSEAWQRRREMFDTWMKYNSKHSDEIYWVPARRMK